MAGVSIQNVEKAFGGVRVIHGIDIEIADGAFVVLVGPSGCGKSTLLRIIAGLEDVTSGAIMIGDTEVNDMAPKDRDIAMVFQNYGLYPHMTVAQNMGFALKLAGVNKAEIAKRVGNAADILNLDALLDRFPRQLSGGQRQRVAMGRAIVRNPQVFLFDEPLSNLDAKLRVQMRAEIKQLHQRLKVTTVYVTHDQIEAMTMADVIVVMHDGVVKQAGSPLDLYDTPANLFVAGFIGSPAMNFMDATVTSGALVFADGQHLPAPEGAALTDGQVVRVGIRPEDLVVADAGLSTRVRIVEPTGAEIHVGAQLGDTPVTVVLRERHDLHPDQTLTVAPLAGRLHLFDPKTEARLN
ncbi:ABC transporter ATP-binding protein [Roseinatronobacter alkalisoli]|uniref:Sn-glycerol-3-phosphate ABC transporter ATP-binding protein UgpC n=1 Tax=Roseinatronobacter alkalisoli TaxID=3028235 RepID=A0ABT5TAY4_9RHOB|nr:sn-glycerol-3-phosphate ABC transporter ATP-binding protein UgpC [Roseinatronobacter sp. HJB301]MDD7972285.1 sn-glycerol-3-phosphate ABC transporter ATP-binding protein UgpC [Roseinatronobacter sp. HJB301]